MTTAISPAPTCGTPAGRSRPRASPSRRSPASRCRRLFERAADRPRAADARPRAAAQDRRLAPLVLREPRSAARGPGRHHPPLGVRPRQFRSTGTRPSSACRPKASSPTCAATPSMPIRRIARPRRSTTAISGWCSASASLGWDNCKAPRRLAVPDRRPRLQRHPDPRCADLADLAERARASRDRRRQPRARRKGDGGAGEAVERGARPVSLPRPRHRQADRQRLGRRAAAGLRRDARRRGPRRSPGPSRGWRRKCPLHRALARSGRSALRRQALLARPGLAGRQLHDRRWAGAAPARRR